MPVTKSAKIDQYGVTVTGLFQGNTPKTLEVYAPANTTVEIIGYQPAGTISKEIMRIVISPRDDLKPTTLSILPEKNIWFGRCYLKVQGENHTKSVGPLDLKFRPVGLPEN